LLSLCLTILFASCGPVGDPSGFCALNRLRFVLVSKVARLACYCYSCYSTQLTCSEIICASFLAISLVLAFLGLWTLKTTWLPICRRQVSYLPNSPYIFMFYHAVIRVCFLIKVGRFLPGEGESDANLLFPRAPLSRALGLRRAPSTTCALTNARLKISSASKKRTPHRFHAC
jgi:hypothetical protein